MKIGGLLKRTHILHSQRINEKLKQYDLTTSQLEVLIKVTIANEKNVLINQRDIEKRTNLTNPTVTGLINRLEMKGLIKRVENDKDKRIKNLYITEKARYLNKEFRNIFDKSDSIALKGFSEEEKENLEKYLLRMMENLMKEEIK